MGFPLLNPPGPHAERPSIEVNRMHRFAFLLLLLANFSAAQADLGDRLHSSQLPHKHSAECASSPSRTFPCVRDVTLGGVHFDIVGYESGHNTIKYLYTTDPQFATKSGYHVGDMVTVNQDEVVVFPGWHICGPRTPDGWRMVFGFDSDDFETIKFEDGSKVELVRTMETPAKRGTLRILGFEKGEV